MNTEIKRKILTVEMDYPRRSEEISNRERTRNQEICGRIEAEKTVFERIRRRNENCLDISRE